MREKAVLFGRYHSLVGVISEPESPPHGSNLGVIFSNAGLIHRVGPNRIYVKISRSLAGMGMPCLRFDLSGVGDSLPRPDMMPVEEFTIDDLGQAMDCLSEAYGCQRFVLIGHCAGAYHSFRTAARDTRVLGVVMINPDGGEAEWVDYDRQRKMARYYENYYVKETLGDLNRWKRFFTGQVSYKNIFMTVWKNVIWSRVTRFIFRIRQQRAKPASATNAGMLYTVEEILNKMFDLETQVLLIYSENSTSYERIRLLMGKTLDRLQSAGKLQVSVIPGADHIFSPVASQKELVETIKNCRMMKLE